MERLIKIAGDLLDFCETQSWRACVIGGLAVQRWGEPRLTRDVDLSLLTAFGQEAVFVEKLIERYEARIEDPQAFALRNRVLLQMEDAVARVKLKTGLVTRGSAARIPSTEPQCLAMMFRRKSF
jgi:hypothetical protein